MGLAASGARNMDTGVEPIADAETRARLSAQAREVKIQSMVVALLLLVVVLILPG